MFTACCNCLCSWLRQMGQRLCPATPTLRRDCRSCPALHRSLRFTRPSLHAWLDGRSVPSQSRQPGHFTLPQKSKGSCREEPGDPAHTMDAERALFKLRGKAWHPHERWKEYEQQRQADPLEAAAGAATEQPHTRRQQQSWRWQRAEALEAVRRHPATAATAALVATYASLHLAMAGFHLLRRRFLRRLLLDLCPVLQQLGQTYWLDSGQGAGLGRLRLPLVLLHLLLLLPMQQRRPRFYCTSKRPCLCCWRPPFITRLFLSACSALQAACWASTETATSSYMPMRSTWLC